MTTGTPPPGPLRRGLQTGRLEALSDGVYAIAITLLVLDIVVPAGAGRRRVHPAEPAAAPGGRLPPVPHQAVRGLHQAARAGTGRGHHLRHQPAAVRHAAVGPVWRYAVRAGLVRPDAADEEVQLLTRRLTPGLAGYLVLIAAGLFIPVVAVIGYLAIAMFYIIPFRRWRCFPALRIPRRTGS